jgi:hypothetical protein
VCLKKFPSERDANQLFPVFAGANLVMVLGLSLLTRDPPAGIAIRPQVLYSSMALFLLGAAFFVYSYVVTDTNVLFYLALALLIVGTGGVLVGVKRNAKV